MSNIKEKFGEEIKKLRKKRHLTQEALASKAGISVDFLSLIERGKSAPSFKNLEKLSSALEVKIKKLFDFK